MNYTFTTNVHLTKDNMIDILWGMIHGSSYWSKLCEDGFLWDDARKQLPEAEIEELLYHVLSIGNAKIIDMQGKTTHQLSMGKLLDGIQRTIDSGRWDGDMEIADSDLCDYIMQYALFNSIIYN